MTGAALHSASARLTAELSQNNAQTIAPHQPAECLAGKQGKQGSGSFSFAAKAEPEEADDDEPCTAPQPAWKAEPSQVRHRKLAL